MANETAEEKIFSRLAQAPSFHPAGAKLFADDWTLEPGDVVTVQSDGEDYSVPIYSMDLQWNGSSRVSIQSTGNQKREPLSALRRKEYSSRRGGYGAQKELEDDFKEFETWKVETDETLESHAAQFVELDEAVEIAQTTIGQTASDAYIVAEATGILLDENGHPVLDEHGHYQYDPNAENTTLSAKINTNATAITNEVTRATAEEGSLSGRITTEAGKITQIVTAVGADGTVTAASIVTAINGSGDSSIVLSADHIDLEGVVTAEQLDTRLLNVDSLFATTGYNGTLYSNAVNAGTIYTSSIHMPYGDDGTKNYSQKSIYIGDTLQSMQFLGNGNNASFTIPNAIATITVDDNPPEGKIGFKYTTYNSSTPVAVNFNIADTAKYKADVGINTVTPAGWANDGEGGGYYNTVTATPNSGDEEDATVTLPTITVVPALGTNASGTVQAYGPEVDGTSYPVSATASLYLQSDDDYIYITSNSSTPSASNTVAKAENPGSGAAYETGYTEGQANTNALMESITHTAGDVLYLASNLSIDVTAKPELELYSSDDPPVVSYITARDDPGRITTMTETLVMPVAVTDATLSRGEITVTSGTTHSGSYTITGSGGNVNIDAVNGRGGANIPVGVESLTMALSLGAPYTDLGTSGSGKWSEENHNYVYSVYSSLTVDEDGNALTRASQNITLEPTDAIDYGKSLVSISTNAISVGSYEEGRHTAASPGSYAITATATDSEGNTKTETSTLTPTGAWTDGYNTGLGESTATAFAQGYVSGQENVSAVISTISHTAGTTSYDGTDITYPVSAAGTLTKTPQTGDPVTESLGKAGILTIPVSVTAATLTAGNWNSSTKKITVSSASGGKVTIDGEDIGVSVESADITVTPGTVTVNSESYENGYYTVTADGTVNINGSTENLTQGTRTFAATAAIASVSAVMTGVATTSGTVTTLAEGDYGLYRTISGTPEETPIAYYHVEPSAVAPKVSKGEWENGQITFTAGTEGDATSSVNLNIGVTGQQDVEGAATITVYDGNSSTGKNEDLYLTETAWSNNEKSVQLRIFSTSGLVVATKGITAPASVDGAELVSVIPGTETYTDLANGNYGLYLTRSGTPDGSPIGYYKVSSSTTATYVYSSSGEPVTVYTGLTLVGSLYPNTNVSVGSSTDQFGRKMITYNGRTGYLSSSSLSRVQGPTNYPGRVGWTDQGSDASRRTVYSLSGVTLASSDTETSTHSVDVIYSDGQTVLNGAQITIDASAISGGGGGGGSTVASIVKNGNTTYSSNFKTAYVPVAAKDIENVIVATDTISVNIAEAWENGWLTGRADASSYAIQSGRTVTITSNTGSGGHMVYPEYIQGQQYDAMDAVKVIVNVSEGQYELATVTLQGLPDSVYVSATSGGTDYYQAGSSATYYLGNGGTYTVQGSAVTVRSLGAVHYYVRHTASETPTGAWYSRQTTRPATGIVYNTEYQDAGTNTYYNAGTQTVYGRGTSQTITPIKASSKVHLLQTIRYKAGQSVSDTYYTRTS